MTQGLKPEGQFWARNSQCGEMGQIKIKERQTEAINLFRDLKI